MVKKIAIAFGVLLVLGFVFFFIASRTSTVVKVEKTLNAPPERVWALFNDAENIKKWWGPDGFHAPVIQNDLRLGGTYLLSMQGPDGKVYWNAGRYTEVTSYSKIVSMMVFADEKGAPVPATHYGLPGRWPDEVEVRIELAEKSGKTKITITETGIPTIMYVFAKLGWQQQFKKMEKLL